jgi:AraC-like DNA-binding protein
MVGIKQMGTALTGKEFEGSADLTCSRPATFERFVNLLGTEIRFNQPTNQLVFSAADLDRPIVLADPVARKLAQEQCERELDALGRQHQATLLERVRSFMAKNEGGFRSLEEVASLTGMSARTLKRRLADLGTAFSTLLEDEQRERALVLLRSDELSIDEIASRVGYSEVANFTRAFRRWTGTTPAAYRRRPS